MCYFEGVALVWGMVCEAEFAVLANQAHQCPMLANVHYCAVPFGHKAEVQTWPVG